MPVLVFNFPLFVSDENAQQQQSFDLRTSRRPHSRNSCISALSAALEPDYFCIANRAGTDSYFFMNRLVSATSLAIACLLVLTGCATDDDPFPVHPAATTTGSEMPVAGAASPAQGKFERGVEVVVACTRELSALITFNSNSFIGSPFFWADRVSPLPYPSLSRHLYAEPVCHLCPKGALVSFSWITDLWFRPVLQLCIAVLALYGQCRSFNSLH